MRLYTWLIAPVLSWLVYLGWPYAFFPLVLRLWPLQSSPDTGFHNQKTGFDETLWPRSPRHVVEQASLLQRLDRGHGKWGTNHARHRLLDALHGFSRYYERQIDELGRLQSLFKNVPKRQKAILEKTAKYSHNFHLIQHLLAENQKFCSLVIESAMTFYGVNATELQQHIQHVECKGHKSDRISVSQTLKHVVRDWAVAGEQERVPAFTCIKETIEHAFPTRKDIKVLVPGSGLGRLGHEISQLNGIEVTLNEWSMYMNILYRLLETLDTAEAQSLYPFVDSWSHHISKSDMQRAINFPDAAIRPEAILLIEGDFTTVLADRTATFDIVVTYFFIDTARNLMSYLETILRVLKPGGIWINYGPLLYGSAPFVQLTLEDILSIVEEMGFLFEPTSDVCGTLTFPEKPVRGQQAIYGFDELAMTRNAYQAQVWVARKPGR